jgi:hypothetical protein
MRTIKIFTNKYGKELRITLGKIIYIFNLSGAIGVGTTNEDLWNNGWRIGFTRLSRFIKLFGIYLLKATYETY